MRSCPVPNPPSKASCPLTITWSEEVYLWSTLSSSTRPTSHPGGPDVQSGRPQGRPGHTAVQHGGQGLGGQSLPAQPAPAPPLASGPQQGHAPPSGNTAHLYRAQKRPSEALESSGGSSGSSGPPRPISGPKKLKPTVSPSSVGPQDPTLQGGSSQTAWLSSGGVPAPQGAQIFTVQTPTSDFELPAPRAPSGQLAHPSTPAHQTSALGAPSGAHPGCCCCLL